MDGMPRVRLIHWNAKEAQPRLEALRSAGYRVDYQAEFGPGLRREIQGHPPDAVVIDLTRRPSMGRDVAVGLRHHAGTRRVPLVCVEGDPEAVAGLRRLLPDVMYTSWSQIAGSLRRAIEHPPANPVKPASVLAGYSGTPLPKKLGIKPGTVVALVGAPEGFSDTLGTLPEGVRFRTEAARDASLTLWFLRSRRDLEKGIGRMASGAGHAPLWMIWPKKTSGLASDLTQQEVREVGLGSGWVDYKVCAVDETWSGLLFRLRRATAATAARGASSTPRKQTKRK
jgi:hypothetical protein